MTNPNTTDDPLLDRCLRTAWREAHMDINADHAAVSRWVNVALAACFLGAFLSSVGLFLLGLAAFLWVLK